MRWAATVAIGGAVAAVVASCCRLRAGPCARRGVAALALLVNALVAAPPLFMYWQAQQLPKIHDISTDTANPPTFEAVLPLRTGAQCGGVSAQQRCRTAQGLSRSQTADVVVAAQWHSSVRCMLRADGMGRRLCRARGSAPWKPRQPRCCSASRRTWWFASPRNPGQRRRRAFAVACRRQRLRSPTPSGTGVPWAFVGQCEQALGGGVCAEPALRDFRATLAVRGHANQSHSAGGQGSGLLRSGPELRRLTTA